MLPGKGKPPRYEERRLNNAIYEFFKCEDELITIECLLCCLCGMVFQNTKHAIINRKEISLRLGDLRNQRGRKAVGNRASAILGA